MSRTDHNKSLGRGRTMLDNNKDYPEHLHNNIKPSLKKQRKKVDDKMKGGKTKRVNCR